MTHVALVLVGLAVLAPLPGAALGPVVVVAAAGAVWWFIECARWPGVFYVPATGWSGRFG